MPLNPEWSYLTPLTCRVVKLMCSEGWLSKVAIAEKLGESPDGRLSVLLPDLAARGILESTTSKVYHLALPEDADPEEYRRQLLAWLDSQPQSGLAGNHGCQP
jgi:hypothetical protein